MGEEETHRVDYEGMVELRVRNERVGGGIEVGGIEGGWTKRGIDEWKNNNERYAWMNMKEKEERKILNERRMEKWMDTRKNE